MKWTAKNIFILVIVGLMILITIIPVFAESKPPFTDENYYNNLCSGESYADNQVICDEYKEYYSDKLEEANKLLKEKNFELSEVKANAKKYSQMYDEINEEVIVLEKQVETIKSGIKKTEEYILKLEEQILEQEKEVEIKEAQVLKYIASSQTQSYTNSFVEFIMGAKDFSEVVSRMEGMKRIKEYNDDVIDDLNKQKEEIEIDKKIAIDSVELMKIDENIASKKVFELEMKASEANNLYKTFSTLVAEVETASEKLEKEVKYSEEQIKNIGDFTSTNGWTHPLGSNKSKYVNNHWGFRYREQGGGSHNGSDFRPVPRGSRINIYAPANGFVALAEENNCGDGSIYNNCGGAWGNYVTLIVDVQGVVYGVSLAHLTSGSISIRQGQYVTAGQQIARMGTSGSSTGVHLHAEVYKLPEKTVQDAARSFQNHRTRNFNTGSHGSGRFCHAGASAPCKIDAPILWGDRTYYPGYYD